MGEIMVSARKTSPSGRARFVSLDRVPESDLEAAYIGRAARQGQANKLEDGPYGGTSLLVGDSVIGRKRSPLRSDSVPDLSRLIIIRATFSAINARLGG